MASKRIPKSPLVFPFFTLGHLNFELPIPSPFFVSKFKIVKKTKLRKGESCVKRFSLSQLRFSARPVWSSVEIRFALTLSFESGVNHVR